MTHMCDGCRYIYSYTECAYDYIKSKSKMIRTVQWMIEEYGFIVDEENKVHCKCFAPVTEEWHLMAMGGRNHGQ